MARQPQMARKGVRTKQLKTAAVAAMAAGGKAIETLEGRVLFAVFTWDGGGANDNWTTAANWAFDHDANAATPALDQAPPADGTAQLDFGGSARKTTNNDYPANTVFEDIEFLNGGWTLGGNAVVINDDVTSSAESGTNTVNFGITMTEIPTAGNPPSSFIANNASALVINGPVTVQAGDILGLRGVSEVTVNGTITGPGGLLKDASGATTLVGDNTYAGNTTIESNSLLTLNHTGGGSATGTGAVRVDGDLRGVGRVGGPLSVREGGDLFPGVGNNTSGVINSGNLLLDGGSRLGINAAGTTAGTGYDQLAVTGTVTIDPEAVLQLTPAEGFTPGNGATFVIISNDGTDGVTGTFADLPEGGRISAGGQTYQISYAGGDGNNDVTLLTVEANDPPVNTVPGDQTTYEGGTLVLTGETAISVADPDAAASPLLMTLAATNGTLTLGGTAGLTFSAGDGASDETMTFTGTAADVNAALATVTYTPAAGFIGASTITVTSNDQGATGPGGAQQDEDVIAVAVADASTIPPVANDDTATRAIGQTVEIDVLANDTDAMGRALTVTIVDQPAGGTATVAGNRVTYAGNGYNGPDTFTYRIDNGEGGTDTATVNVATTGAAGFDVDPENNALRALFINGTANAEKIVIAKRKGGGVRVLLGKTEIFSDAALPSGSVIVDGGAGNDVISVGILKNSAFRVNGGDGDDRINTGNLNDVVIGGTGNDKISTGRGNDIAIGGGGADKVLTAAGDDILVGSATDYNQYTAANSRALSSLLATWNNGADYASRVAAIQAGVGSAGARFSSETIDTDNDVDNLVGAAGSDVYFGQANDRAKPQKNVETLITIS